MTGQWFFILLVYSFSGNFRAPYASKRAIKTFENSLAHLKSFRTYCVSLFNHMNFDTNQLISCLLSLYCTRRKCFYPSDAIFKFTEFSNTMKHVRLFTSLFCLVLFNEGIIYHIGGTFIWPALNCLKRTVFISTCAYAYRYIPAKWYHTHRANVNLLSIIC